MKNRMTSFGVRHSVPAFVTALAFFPECHLAEDHDSNRRNSCETAGMECEST